MYVIIPCQLISLSLYSFEVHAVVKYLGHQADIVYAQDCRIRSASWKKYQFMMDGSSNTWQTELVWYLAAACAVLLPNLGFQKI